MAAAPVTEVATTNTEVANPYTEVIPFTTASSGEIKVMSKFGIPGRG